MLTTLPGAHARIWFQAYSSTESRLNFEVNDIYILLSSCDPRVAHYFDQKRSKSKGCVILRIQLNHSLLAQMQICWCLQKNLFFRVNFFRFENSKIELTLNSQSSRTVRAQGYFLSAHVSEQLSPELTNQNCSPV